MDPFESVLCAVNFSNESAYTAYVAHGEKGRFNGKAGFFVGPSMYPHKSWQRTAGWRTFPCYGPNHQNDANWRNYNADISSGRRCTEQIPILPTGTGGAIFAWSADTPGAGEYGLSIDWTDRPWPRIVGPNNAPGPVQSVGWRTFPSDVIETSDTVEGRRVLRLSFWIRFIDFVPTVPRLTVTYLRGTSSRVLITCPSNFNLLCSRTSVNGFTQISW